MTLLRESEQPEQEEKIEEKLEAEVGSEAGSDRRGRAWKRSVAIAVLSLLGVVLAVAVFTGPIERIWYHNRQHQLAADMNHPREGVAPGQAIAVLQVPRLGVNVVVVEGDNPERLRSGPGHRIGTAKPGTLGNSVIMGHRTAWGGPFGALDKVRRGDLIAVQTRAHKTLVYKVRSIEDVGGGDLHLLRSSKEHRLTLVTGRGGRFSDDRLVVSAVSGAPARSSSSIRPIRGSTPGPSLIFSLSLLLAIIAFILAAGADVYLRRRSGPLARAVVLVPLIAGGVLCLLLDLDLLLPPLI